MLQVGIVGLPNAGKSTLFNALLSKGKALTGKHPFTTTDKNIGVVPVPDSLLSDLAKMAAIPKVTPTTVTFVDIAGLVKEAHKGEGLGNQFLAHIREVDLILHLVRFFTDQTVPHIHAQIDPKEDVSTVETELLLSDVESLTRQIEKLRKKAKSKEVDQLLELAEKILANLNQETQAKDIKLSPEEEKLMRKFHLLTDKPTIYVANIDEEELGKKEEKIDNQETITLSALFEEELAKLKWVEQRQFLKDYGLSHSRAREVIKRCYSTLEMITFYTIAGGKEARAWTAKKGIKAIEAAAKVHTDFGKKFIKAEVIPAHLLLQLGSWRSAHDKGKIALVGKDQPIKDGDVVEFKVAV